MRLLIFIASIFMLFSCNSTGAAQKEEIIVDVRTVEEWNLDGHADCSVNYPIDQLESKIEEILRTKVPGKILLVLNKKAIL